MRVLAGGFFLVGLLTMASLSSAQPPGGGKFGKGQFGKGGGGFAMSQPGQIMPAFLATQLKLTDDQKKQVEMLQKDVDDKLAKILAEDQQKQLKDMKDRVVAAGLAARAVRRWQGGRQGRRQGRQSTAP